MLNLFLVSLRQWEIKFRKFFNSTNFGNNIHTKRQAWMVCTIQITVQQTKLSFRQGKCYNKVRPSILFNGEICFYSPPNEYWKISIYVLVY